MRIPLTVVMLLCVAAANVRADSTDKPGAVPDSVLEALGLSDLVVDPAGDDPVTPPAAESEPVTAVDPVAPADAQAAPEPDVRTVEAIEAVTPPVPAIIPTPDPQADRRQLVSNAKADVETAKRHVANVQRTLDENASAREQAQQNLKDAQTSAVTVNRELAEVTEKALKQQREGMVVVNAVTVQDELVKRLIAIHEEFKKLSETHDDADVAAVQAEVHKLLAVKQQTLATTSAEMDQRVDEFQGLKQELLALREEAVQKQQAVTDAQSRVDELKDAQETAREQLRLADLAAQTAAQQLSELEPAPTDPSAPVSQVTPAGQDPLD